MTFNPFSAINEASQIAKGAGYLNSKSVFNGVDRTHLIGNRTDPANSCCNVRSVFVGPSSEKSFKKPGRFKDFEFYVHHLIILDLNKKSSLSLNTGKVIHFNGFIFLMGHESHFPFERVLNRH